VATTYDTKTPFYKINYGDLTIDLAPERDKGHGFIIVGIHRGGGNNKSCACITVNLDEPSSIIEAIKQVAEESKLGHDITVSNEVFWF